MLNKSKYIRAFFITALAFYWPGIFFLTHIPQVPGWILRAQMSDKTLHFIGYMLLTYLWWNAVSFDRRPSLKYYFTWLTLALMAIYGIADEIIQGFTHRTPDITDFRADMIGTALALLLMAVFELRIASAAVMLTVVFTLTVLSHSDPFAFVPALGYAFYFAALALPTVLWFDFVCDKISAPGLGSRLLRSFLAIVLPLASLAVIYFAARHAGRQLMADRLASALLGIICGIFMAMLIRARISRRRQNQPQNQNSSCSVV